MSAEEVSSVPIYEVPPAIKGKTDIDFQTYQRMYRRSVDDPEGFWAEMAEKFVSWHARWQKVLQWDFNTAEIEWFKGGKTNICYNALDRHLKDKADRIALYAAKRQGKNRVVFWEETEST